jgi:glycosyltransferase involved in cell wall biosynthesis
MEEQIFVSICIPAYNRKAYLQRLLDSIQEQSYRHFEVVLTDDSPGSEVYDLVRHHALGISIRYYKNESTLGTPENWNEGIRRATGPWIKLMHDDDWFRDADALGGFIRVIKKNKADFYFSAYHNVYPDKHTEPVYCPAAFLSRLNRNPEILLAANRIGPPSAVIFRNDPQISFDRRFRWLVDFDFYMAYLKAHPPAVYIHEPLVCIGISESQVTQSSFGKPEIEIPERLMIWGKMNPRSSRDLRIYDSWWRFVRNLQIASPAEIREAGYKGPLPLFVVSMIGWQKYIPGNVLKQGFFSKILMLGHYLIHYGTDYSQYTDV